MADINTLRGRAGAADRAPPWVASGAALALLFPRVAAGNGRR
jgi:hypothetical protein